MPSPSLPDIRRWSLGSPAVLICGLERSGTSMLQVALARHPALFDVPDVYETFAFAQPAKLLEAPAPTMVKAYLRGRDEAWRAQVQALRAGGPALSEADLVRAFFHFCATEVYPGRQPLEKTPAHVQHLQQALELFPRARVLVCTRDPVSVVASYRKRLAKEQALGKPRSDWGWLDRSADQLLSHFERISAHLQAAQRRWPEQVFVAPYDWLTDAPEAALREVCTFAGLPWHDAVLRPADVGGRVDELLSQPITRREADDARFVDEATATRIRQRMAHHRALWDTPGLVPVPVGAD